MSEEQNPWGGWSLMAGWIPASTCGWAAGLAVGMLLSLAVSRVTWLNVNEDRFFAHATLILLGLTIGAAQSVVMRRRLPKPILWLVATLAGHLVCLVVIAGGNLVGLARAGAWDDVLLLGLLGAAIGTCQRLTLRRRFCQFLREPLQRSGNRGIIIAVVMSDCTPPMNENGTRWPSWCSLRSASPGSLPTTGCLLSAILRGGVT